MLNISVNIPPPIRLIKKSNRKTAGVICLRSIVCSSEERETKSIKKDEVAVEDRGCTPIATIADTIIAPPPIPVHPPRNPAIRLITEIVNNFEV